jgi:hypothetical protein
MNVEPVDVAGWLVLQPGEEGATQVPIGNAPKVCFTIVDLHVGRHCIVILHLSCHISFQDDVSSANY